VLLDTRVLLTERLLMQQEKTERASTVPTAFRLGQA
jgi:hypothetical protein